MLIFFDTFEDQVKSLQVKSFLDAMDDSTLVFFDSM